MKISFVVSSRIPNNSIEKQNVVQIECLCYFKEKNKTVNSLLNYNLNSKSI